MTEADPPTRNETPEDRLNSAKEKFGKAILENDLLFAAIREELKRYAHLNTEQELPDFQLEPWRPRSKVEDRQIFGLRLTQAVNLSSEEVPALKVGFGVYGYVPVVEIDLSQGKSRGEAHSTDEIKAHGTQEEQSAALYHFWGAYKAFLKDVGIGEDGSPSAEVTVDPHSGTFDLIEDINNRFYQSDFEEKEE